MTGNLPEIIQRLYKTPIESLGLTDDVREAVTIFEVKTVGQWIDEYSYLLTDSRIFGDDSFTADDLYFMMHGEILLKIKKRDDWPLIVQYIKQG